MNPKKIVTRFAPSPTGYLHAGNYRTAVFAYLLAKKEDGEFIVRIEDTDRERSKPEYEANIWETLNWLSLKPDRTYRQSEQASRHTSALQQLIDAGSAYVSTEETGDRKEVIRFKNAGETVTFTDMIRGDISFDTAELGDFVIARSLTEPVFHFAVVVDDHDAGVTHVIRGEDHISNTPRQILIGRALGMPTPAYIHLPLVLSTDRTKLSKRRGAKALTDYRDKGYVPEAMINYLALLGWHPEGERELFSLEELQNIFTLERIQKSAGIFDEVKLRWFNQEHLRHLSPEAFADRLSAFAKRRGVALPPYTAVAMPVVRERAQTLADALELLHGECAFLNEHISYDAGLLIKGAKASAAQVHETLNRVAQILSDMPEPWTPAGVKDLVFPYATEAGRASVLWSMRVALSGMEQSPDPFTLAALLGKEKTLARIAEAAQKTLQ